tara:strand:- start:150 stop:389 length:240 start_codon:yes stop_codon:yes gene_type:complete
MIYAQFYTDSFLDGVMREALGDRSVLRLDARMGKSNWHGVATSWAHKHGYIGFALHKGHLRDHKPCNRGDIKLVYPSKK